LIVRRFLSSILLFGTVLCAPSFARAQSPADTALARELFVEGADFAKKGQWNEARQRYERALALKRAPRILYSLGIAYRNLRRFVEAIESYRAFLVEMDKVDDKPYEQPARDAIAELEKLVAKVDIKVFVPDRDAKLFLTIDGIIVPEAAHGYPRLVDPGRHTIAAKASGFREATQVVTVAEGEQTQVNLRLRSIDNEPLPPGETTPATPSNIVPTALLGGGIAAFAVGLTVGLVGVQRASNSPTADGEVARSARRLAVIGDVVGGVGVIVGGAGLTLLLIEKFGKTPPAPAKSTSGWVLPVVTPTGAALVGQF
jgi:Tetratricopeptide repeat